MFILFGVGPASHTSSALLGSTWCQLYSSSVLSWNLIFHARLCCISTWCHDIHLLRALQELYIYVCHAVYFYMMSAVFTYYALSRNLIFYARQCCIFLRDVIGVHLLWALGELEILCASVSFVNDMISSHTPVVARNIHVILMLFIYQHFVQHRCALLCWVTVHISIVDFHTECVYFDEHGAEFLWWPPGVGRLYLNVNMSKRQRKLNEKGLGLLERNLRGKCASAIRAANKVVNKLIPLLKSDNSDLEPVKEYSVELHQYIALIVDTQEEFDSKFAGHLEILASFGEWLQPRFDVLKSVLEYSTAWIDSTTTMSEVPSGAGILPIDNDIEPEDSISQLSAARSRSDRHSNASSKSRSRVSKSSSSSHVSSIKSARVKESLKKVTLMAEARNLVERQSLLRKEFELSMEKQSLDLSTNLAIATAKEEILLNAELDNDNMTGSCVSEVRSKPVGTGPSVCSSVKPEGLLTDDPSVHLSTKGDKVTDVADMSIVTGQLSNISVSVLPVHPSVCDSVVQPVCRMVETDTTSLAARTLSSATSDTVHFPLRSGEGLQSRGLGKCHVAQADSRMHHSTPSVSTTPSFCHGSGTKMTVVCGDQVAQPHLDTGADRQKSSSTPVGGSGELLQASVGTSRCGLNPSSPVFRPRYSDVQQVNGAGDSVHFPHVVDRSDCLRPGFQDGFLDGAVGSRFVDRVPGDYGTGVGLRNEIKVESAFDKLADVLRDQRHRLPELSVPKFGGDPLEYVSFIRSFDSRVASRTSDERERLYFLEQFTTGTPREIVRSCIMMPSWLGYVEARRRLDERFGNPFVLGQCYLKRLEKWPSISRDDVKRLDDFTTFLIGCRNAMTATESIKELDYPTSLRLIVSKLPGYLQDRWARVADKTLYHEGNLVTFNKLVEFLESENRIRLNPVFGKAALSSTDRNKGGASNQNRKVTSAGTVAKTTSDKTPAPHSVSISESLCMFCELPHSFITCRKFRKILHKDKISFLMKHRLCFDCLGRDHMRSQCSQRATCEVCKGAHPTLLHRSRAGTDQSGVNSPVPGADSASVSTAVDQSRSSASGVPAVTSAAVKRCHTLLETMPIVPVRVKSVFGDKECCTYAFLDSGSSDTLMTEHLMRDLGVCGKKTTINLTTLNADSVPTSCFAVSNLEVCGLNESVFVPLPVVFTQESMPVSREQVPSQDDINRWTYLSHIAVPALDAEVGILIGNNVPKATEPWEVVNSLGDGPYAVRSLLGWSINGPLRCVSVEDSQCPSVSSCRVQVVCNLDDQLNRFFNLDFSENHAFAEGKGLSVEDRQFLRMTEEGTVFRDGHYEVNLPLRNPTVFVPNNRALAVQRLKSIKKRFGSDPSYKMKYVNFIDDLFVKGHASQVPEGELARNDGQVWYLPHFGVVHPQKDKLRVVLDAAARFSGTSLNDLLLSGPDLTNSLVGVLHRFRQDRVAFISDLECMFYQVKVPALQRDFLRFLWWPGGDISKEVIECRMHTHIFGATSSPAVATFALHKTAADNADFFSSEAVETVKRSFYVDDCLKSLPTVGEAVALAIELRELTQQGGFHLAKWVSNSRELLSSIPDKDRSKNVQSVDLDYDDIPSEKALGVLWTVEADQLGFHVKNLDKPATRRGVLSTISSLYDPLGMAAPFILAGKMILQDLCRQKLGWDEDIPEDLLIRWRQWLQELPALDNFSMDRCFKPAGFGEIKTATLHHFADASDHGYGSVSYLRLVNRDDQVHCSFVCGKSRVAPLKQMTIPRMELTSAVVAAKVDKQLRSELTLPLEDSHFWSDSTSVLGYVKNKKARFNIFVANRVAVIHELSENRQWHYVPSQLNPADDASRGLDGKALLQCQRWKSGPGFLWGPDSEWPLQPNSHQVDDKDPELKKIVCSSARKEGNEILHRILAHFSDWFRLRRFVALMCRAVKGLQHSLSKKVGSDPRTFSLSADDLRDAEMTIVRWVQARSFALEMASLESGNGCLTKSNRLAPLDPIIVNGIVRVGGRIGKAPVSDDVKHPVLLPLDSPVSSLLVKKFHEDTGHGGREQVLSRLRQRYWIIHGNALTRRVLKSCVFCRRQFGAPLKQKMADLPLDRITPAEPPFTNTGVDYFGPILVKRGRCQVKRYGALFTCLVFRAVHIEMAASLDTPSFINVLRRFVARRGQVKLMRSDNGTNLVGAQRELRQAIQEWNQAQVEAFLLQKEVTWCFNAPSASHHGGAWERLIRSTRRILLGLTKEQVLDDDGLSTLLAEVESVLNGRPLTKSSSDPQDLTCLTPNHLLLLKDQPSLPPGMFSEADNYVRRRWRQIQYLSDLFWKRWVPEYLTVLQDRQKWLFPKRNVQVNDVVLIVDQGAPRGSWLLGRVIETYPDKNGYVRNVAMKTRSSRLVRPVSKLVMVLECDE